METFEGFIELHKISLENTIIPMNFLIILLLMCIGLKHQIHELES